jgi:hypothetical protein
MQARLAASIQVIELLTLRPVLASESENLRALVLKKISSLIYSSEEAVNVCVASTN